MLRRRGLSVSPRFLWECLTSRTVSPFPAPATSHAACGFPALRAPAQLPAKGLCDLSSRGVFRRSDEISNSVACLPVGKGLHGPSSYVFLGLAAPAWSCAWTSSQSSGAMIRWMLALVDTPLVPDAAGVERIG